VPPKAQLRIGKRILEISNAGKLLYPAAKFTKADVVDYYVRISKWMLPHLKNRPVTLKRYPDGVFGKSFYEKNAPSFTPEWVKTFPVPRRAGGPDIRYILINNVATLAWCASIAALEIHPFLHRVPNIDRPTTTVFDLDPGQGTDILTCGRVAFLLKELLERLGLQSFAKVSGSKGLQVYVPLNTPITYEVTGTFAKAVAEYLERENPALVISHMAKTLRKGKVFIDWSQNAEHKTTVAVYSLRAKQSRPYVSLPVTWDELRRAVDRRDKDSLYFEAKAALPRVEKVGDLFHPVLTLKQKIRTGLEGEAVKYVLARR
jgi:bifunctional non-homologous end joining protein LigD